MKIAALILAMIAVALSGCVKTERKDDHAPVNRSGYWHTALNGKLAVPCVPNDTKVITPDTPTIFRDECPKGWQQTNMYYKKGRKP